MRRSAGCGKAAKASPAAGDAKSVTVGGKKRTFLEYVPAGYDPQKNYPVVLTLHGIGATGTDMSQYIEMQTYVAGGAIVEFPDGEGGSWDLSGAKDLDFFDALVDATSRAFCVDRARIHAFGFSYGAKMVHHLGCKRTGRLRAIAAGDGSWAAEEGCGSLPVLVTHRTRDDDELVGWGRGAMTRWLGHNGCAKTTTAPDALGCVAHDGCKKPVIWCEDTFYDATWPRDWNHTVREEHRDRVWRFFRDLR